MFLYYILISDQISLSVLFSWDTGKYVLEFFVNQGGMS